ncbi:hypothetical protein [Changchengzhania lutea]|uniref:hypothetical protein n=1 Tax=Changchengzhania lutea TaxID=2049305 RepID=UPI00115F639D|nr:hypothetical protein [Changchengzhania lutea]
MKNIFLSTFTIFLILTSCSSDDNEGSIIVVPKLLTNTTSTYNGENSVGYEFVYNEAKKLIKQKRTDALNNEDEYVYNNENVVRINRSYDDNAIVSIAYTLLEYDGENKIKRLTQYDTDDNIRYDFLYTYSSENILLTRNIIGIVNNSNRFYDYEYNATENSLKRTQRTVSDAFEIYTFDNKKSPYTNIPYILKELTAAGMSLNVNNISKIEYYESGVITRTINYLNDYDNDDFLIKSTYTDINNNTRTYTYIYNK